MDATLIHATVLQVLRWAHFFFGIAWIGHLYYFNFVAGNAEKALDGAMKKVVVPNFRGRAIWWFRWGAMLTFLSGVTYVLYQEFISARTGFGGWFGTTNAQNQFIANTGNWWITYGMTLGTIMWFNVWFIIWPRQKVIIPAIMTGNKPADFDALVAKAGKFSRINTYLSVPMLFGMGGRSHFPLGSTQTLVAMTLVTVVGIGIAYHLVNGAAAKVASEFHTAPPPPPPKA